MGTVLYIVQDGYLNQRYCILWEKLISQKDIY